jgi:hypothetical protein
METSTTPNIISPLPKTLSAVSSKRLEHNSSGDDGETAKDRAYRSGDTVGAAIRKSPISDVEAQENLASSGRWSDSDPSPEAFISTSPDPVLSEPLQTKQKRSGRKSPSQKTAPVEPKSHKQKQAKPAKEEPPLTAEEEDRYEAPVIWLKKMFKLSESTVKEAILTTFRNADLHSVAIADMFTTASEVRDHAYIILNSSKASKLLTDGTLSVVVTIPKRKVARHDSGDESDEAEQNDDADTPQTEDIVLWFEKGNHLWPASHQDAFTLYVWQLPTNIKGSVVEAALRKQIGLYCPAIDVTVDENDDGLCSGWAKAFFHYEFDTQKCVYMLNFRPFLGTEIRASFCNTDRATARKAPKKDVERKSNPNPRLPERTGVSKKTSPEHKRRPAVKDNGPTRKEGTRRDGNAVRIGGGKPSTTDEWQVVGREGRRK